MASAFQAVFWQPESTISPAHRNCSALDDQRLGPISTCRLDFTLLFEQSVLSWWPALLLITYVPFGVYKLLKGPRKVFSNRIRGVKIFLASVLVLLNIILLVQWILVPHTRTAASVPASFLNIITSLALIPLIQLEDERNAKPSTSLTIYFLFSSLLDIPQLRTLTLRKDAPGTISTFTLIIVTKLLLFLLENQSKRQFLRLGYTDLPPEATSGVVNRSFLWWLHPLFVKGTEGVIRSEDLFDLDERLHTSFLREKILYNWDSRSRPEWRLTFILTLVRTFRSDFAKVIFPRLCLIGFTFGQPILITAVMNLLTKEDDARSRMEGYGLILSALIIYSGIAISQLHADQNLFRFITMFRGATVSLIYDRSLSTAARSAHTAAVSLMSTDVDRISFVLQLLNECWSRSLELCIGITLLARQLGWVSIMPLAVVALSSIGSSFVAKHIGTRQAEWAEATQQRIGMTTTVLNEIKGIKMTGLQEKASEILQNGRIKETKRQERYTWIIVWMNVVANIPAGFAPPLTFAIYAIQSYLTDSGSLDPVRAFTSLAIIMLISGPAAELLSAVPQVVASIGCFDRIQLFLLEAEGSDALHLSATPSSSDESFGDEPRENGDPTLSGIMELDYDIIVSAKNVGINQSERDILLLHAVNFNIWRGSLVMITGAVGAGKSTLLFSILGESGTIVGEILVSSKSIGYCSQSPWIPNGTIKDIICGGFEVDEDWYDSVINACALSEDIAILPNGNLTVVGSRGSTLSGGQKQRISLARAVYSRSELLLLDDVFSALDAKTESVVFSNLFDSKGICRSYNMTVILATHSMEHLQNADTVLVVNEGTVLSGTYDELTKDGTLRADITNLNSYVNIETKETDEKVVEVKTENPDLDHEIKDLKRKPGDIEVYRYYFKSIGWRNLLIFVSFASLNVLSTMFSSIWLKWFADDHGGHLILFILVYVALSLGCSLGTGGYAWAIAVVIGPSTGRKLHEVLLHVVMNAPMSFFTTTDTGIILNRFSQDMTLIEIQLSTGLLVTVTNFLSVLADAALIAMGSYYMVITLPFTLVAIYYLQKVYLRTSRQLRILELESRSPVYSHFLETLEGLATIRGFRWQTRATEENERRLDESQKPYYLMFCIQRWLTLVLDLMIAGLATAVVALATSLRFSTNVGLLGISMNAILAFNQSIAQFINGWTLLETSLGAISRLKDLEKEVLPEKEALQILNPLAEWPAQGLVEIRGVNASYGSTQALKDINLTVQPGQHIAICGRTGSGKSSLIGTLLRLLPVSSGSITIDSVDISKISLSMLRQRIVTIPQDFIHLPGTLRLNLDPLNRNSDSDIELVLQRVSLWENFAAREGINTIFTTDMVSRGQLQLLALARVILQQNIQRTALLILDEVTSTLDTDTEAKFFQILKDTFASCTIISIAHRQRAIDEADLVVAMENGRIVHVGERDEVENLIHLD